MNDIELDEMLNMWSVPEVSASLRERVRAGYVRRETIREKAARWLSVRRLAGAAVAGVAALLLIVTRAVPQTVPEVRPPYTVVSEFVRYRDDGSAAVAMYGISYNDQGGREVMLSRALPGSGIMTVMARSLDAARHSIEPLLLRMARVSDAQLAMRGSNPGVVTQCAEHSCLLGVGSYSLPKAAGNPGMGCVDGPAVGRETILGYPTVGAMVPLGGRRMTVWMAPALGCFALRIAMEERRADGRFRLVSGKRAIEVRMNP